VKRVFEFRLIVIEGINVKRNPSYNPTLGPIHPQTEDTNYSIEFKQPCPVVATDALLDIGMVVISAVLSLDDNLLQTNISCALKFCYQSVYYVIPSFLVKKRIPRRQQY
jgi:hypothetical protein